MGAMVQKREAIFSYLLLLMADRIVFRARRFLKVQKIDLAHHLTGGMDWMPSGLAFLDLPFVWGSIGSEDIHPDILRTLPSVRAKEMFRKVMLYFCKEIDPLVRLTGKRAKVILSHTPENIPKRYQGKLYPLYKRAFSPPHGLQV